jgi:streptogramin lyase
MTEVLQSAAGVRQRLAVPTWRLGWSEGDAWTVGIGLTLALALAVSTVPAVLDARKIAPRVAAPAGDAPLVPAAPAAPAAPPADAMALPPAVPPAQPLLGRPVPPAPSGAEDAVTPPPAPGPASGPVGAAPPAPGEVRQFAALRTGSAPGAVTAARDGSVWAGTDAPGQSDGSAQLLMWDPVGVLKGTVEVPEQPADRTRGLTGMELLPDGSLAAVDAATDRLLRYDPAVRAWSTLARVPDVAPCLVLAATSCQPGVLDTAPLLRGMTVDAAGSTYVADAGQGIIWRLAPGTSIQAWYSSADLAGEQGLAGLAVDADGHLLAVATRLAGLQGTAAGALLRVDRAEDGSAGARTVVAAFQTGEDPVDVALGASGSAYVALQGVDALVTLDSTGFEQLRVVDDALQQPTAISLGAGRVLVAVAAPAPAVLAVGVDDAPLVLASPPSTAGGPTRD